MNQNHMHMLQAIEDIERMCKEACEAALNDDYKALDEAVDSLISQAQWATASARSLSVDIFQAKHKAARTRKK